MGSSQPPYHDTVPLRLDSNPERQESSTEWLEYGMEMLKSSTEGWNLGMKG
jgi:hypothetical protein